MIKHILLTVAATLLCICRIDAQYRLNMDSIINESIRIVTKDIISKNPEYAEYGRIVLTDYTLPPFFKFDSKEKHLGILRASSLSQDELIAKKILRHNYLFKFLHFVRILLLSRIYNIRGCEILVTTV